MIETLRQQLEAQQQHNQLLQEGLLVAQQNTTTALEKVAVPREVRPGNVSDFRKLQPSLFSSVGSSLQAEQWLVDTANLLRAAGIPDVDQVEVIKIQLTDIARTWWLAEEDRLEKPVAWSQFSASFYKRFFPQTARREMEDQFIRLKQRGRSVDEYAA